MQFIIVPYDAELCAEVQVSSSLVRLGSAVTATCIIREDCPQLAGQAAHIQWHLENRLIPGSPAANDSSRVSTTVVSSFNLTRAVLTCSIRDRGQPEAGVVIRAGCEEIPLRICTFISLDYYFFDF